jgi:acetoacetate decarboxylase
MTYKHRSLDPEPVRAALAAPGFVLKIIAHVDGTPRICELVRYCLEGVVVKGASTGPAALELRHHAMAPVALLFASSQSNALTGRSLVVSHGWFMQQEVRK